MIFIMDISTTTPAYPTTAPDDAALQKEHAKMQIKVIVKVYLESVLAPPTGAIFIRFFGLIYKLFGCVCVARLCASVTTVGFEFERKRRGFEYSTRVPKIITTTQVAITLGFLTDTRGSGFDIDFNCSGLFTPHGVAISISIILELIL